MLLEIKKKRKELQIKIQAIEQEILEIQRRIPNMTHPDAPVSIFKNGKIVGFTVRKQNMNTMRNVRELEAQLGIERPEKEDDNPDLLMTQLKVVEKITGLPEVTPDHIERAKRMIGCILDVEEVSQWLANDDALKAKIKKLEEREMTGKKTTMRNIRPHFNELHPEYDKILVKLPLTLDKSGAIPDEAEVTLIPRLPE